MRPTASLSGQCNNNRIVAACYCAPTMNPSGHRLNAVTDSITVCVGRAEAAVPVEDQPDAAIQSFALRVGDAAVRPRRGRTCTHSRNRRV